MTRGLAIVTSRIARNHSTRESCPILRSVVSIPVPRSFAKPCFKTHTKAVSRWYSGKLSIWCHGNISTAQIPMQ